jgi:hypothetical protein
VVAASPPKRTSESGGSVSGRLKLVDLGAKGRPPTSAVAGGDGVSISAGQWPRRGVLVL